MRLVILTGLSGSGKSTAARALEDEGFYVVDNLPPLLLPQLLELTTRAAVGQDSLAVVIDARSRDFLTGLDRHLDFLQQGGCRIEIFFIDADDDTLVRRYSETRRRHPLAKDEPVAVGIQRERLLLQALRERASQVVDSTRLTPHQLRARIIETVRGGRQIPLAIMLQSFGFRYGIPNNSDLVMDVRFLPNPHFVPELRPLSGRDTPVLDYLLAQPVTLDFLGRFRALLEFLIPQYQREGKSYLTISVGCTGGRHRSVALVEELARFLRLAPVELHVEHRDVARG